MQKDKLWHFAGGLIIAIVVGLPFSLMGETYVIAGFVAATIAGVLKETADHFRQDGTGWDWKDLGATVGGGFVGTIINLILITCL